MSRILIFGGTTEGRRLAQIFAKNKIETELCVASEYGEKLMEFSDFKELSPSENSFLKIKTGRISKDEMENLCENGYSAVVDATHPFAAVVTDYIRQVFPVKIPVVRLERELSHADENFCEYFESVSECAVALEKFSDQNPNAKILLTTGSKDLKSFCCSERLRKNLVVRVLPAFESLKICMEAGLEGRQIVAMQGPFSVRMNEIQIKDFGISALVTKESGKNGGLDSKILAAKNCGIKCFVIKKPETENRIQTVTQSAAENYKKAINIEETCEILGKIIGKKIEICQRMELFLCGIGMGSANSMTFEVTNYIRQADFVFGAERMLQNLKIQNLDTTAEKIPFYLAKDIIPKLDEIKRGSAKSEIKAAFLFSGDTGFFSGAAKLKAGLENHYKNDRSVRISVAPGISTLSYLSAKTGISYENAKIISLHGIDEKIWRPSLEKSLEKNELIFFLTSGTEDVKKIGEIIKNIEKSGHNDEKFKVILGLQLSYPDEAILNLSSDECLKINRKGLCSGFIIYGR